MIAKAVAAVVGGLQGVLKILILWALIIGLIVWWKANPEQGQALFSKAFDAVASIVNWVCDQIIRLLGPSS